MKILSCNVNGLRSAHKKGFLDIFQREVPDIFCLQEIKTYEDQLPSEFQPKDYYSYFNPAQRKGYSGLAVYTRPKPTSIETSIGHTRFDKEGRLLKLEYPGFSLINIYIPYGGRQKHDFDYKFSVYEALFDDLTASKNKRIILVGDFNVAHKPQDIARPKENKNNTMFTPKEREQIDRIINLGFVDSFRKFNKEGGNYTWWPYAHKARERNLGWRIDYVFASRNLSRNVKDAFILPRIQISDHCPIGVELYF